MEAADREGVEGSEEGKGQQSAAGMAAWEWGQGAQCSLRVTAQLELAEALCLPRPAGAAPQGPKPTAFSWQPEPALLTPEPRQLH